MNKIFVGAFLLFFISCKQAKTDIVKDNFDFASKQLTYALTEVESALPSDTTGRKFSPRTIDPKGNLVLVARNDWTSGFFPGELWYMYEYTKDDKWKKEAEKFTARMSDERFNKASHDLGFKVYCSVGNGYRLTKSETYKNELIDAANSLISRYQPNAKIIRSWDHNKDKWACPVIIDNMMNLELLFWAFNETKDSVYYNIAVNHADQTIKNHFREDFSSYHVVDYDTITGNVIKKQTHQGYSHESAWARGQAWAIYGYTMCYRATKDKRYLDQAIAVTNYVFSHKNLPTDLIPYWDFNAPEIPNESRDASAATVTASALYELSTYDTANAGKYLDYANTILQNLSDNYKAKLNESRGFLLLHSTGSRPMNHEVDVPLVYADYYYLEALLRKEKLMNKRSLF